MLNKYKTKLLVLLVVLLGLATLFFCFKDEKVYTLKSYYSDTKVTDISEYVIRNDDTVFHGKFAQYNEKGDKIAEGNFVNGEPNGKSIYYFDNGNIKSIHYRLNSKIDIEGIWNYPNGNIERYIMYDEFGNPVFIIRYDEHENVKKYDGYALVEVYQYKFAHPEKFKIKTNQVLRVGDTLKHKYLLANIPKATRSLKIKLIDADYLGHRSKITNNPPVEINARNVLTTKGVNAIKAVVEYKFNDINKTVVKDSVYFEVIVN